jgi:hypothetical protein
MSIYSWRMYIYGWGVPEKIEPPQILIIPEYMYYLHQHWDCLWQMSYKIVGGVCGQGLLLLPCQSKQLYFYKSIISSKPSRYDLHAYRTCTLKAPFYLWKLNFCKYLYATEKLVSFSNLNLDNPKCRNNVLWIWWIMSGYRFKILTPTNSTTVNLMYVNIRRPMTTLLHYQSNSGTYQTVCRPTIASFIRFR